MKILLKLDSSFFTDEQNQSLYNEMIEIDWDLPFIPKKDELFDFEEIVEEEKWPSFYEGNLSWSVDFVNYTKKNKALIPVIWLTGE